MAAEFTYTNVGTPAAIDRNGKRIVHTNVVRVWREDGVVKYDRRYVSADGTVSESPIEHTFEGNPSTMEIAKMIHWGCCGWSAGGHQIYGLRDKIAALIGQ